jgi:hypothetical protein
MQNLELEIEFEELPVRLMGKPNFGLIAQGYAKLEGDEEGFSVTEIWLHGELVRPRGNGFYGLPSPFADEVFNLIAVELENPKTKCGKAAASDWDDFIDGHRGSVGDREASRADSKRDMAVAE